MNIVILGDCAINGNNSIGHIVFDDPDMAITFSTAYHFRKNKQISYYRGNSKDALTWFLANKKRHKSTKITDIQPQAIASFKNHIKENNVTNVTHKEEQLAKWYSSQTGLEYDLEKALKLIRKKELEYHWSGMLIEHKVYNYAINGNSYGNYIVRLKKHVNEHGKPDLVIMSDFALGHYFAYFKRHGRTHHAVMTYGFMDRQYNKDLDYSKEVFDKKKELFTREMSKTKQYHLRKNKKYRNLLVKYLIMQDINFIDCFYRQENLHFKQSNYIDFTELRQEWDNPGYPKFTVENDHCASKLSTANRELELVLEQIEKIKTN